MKVYKRKGTNYSGEKFGLWTVIRFDKIEGQRANYWLCRCKCGREMSCQIARVKNQPYECTGCNYVNPNWKHGLSGGPTYRSWCGAKERCLDINCIAYPDYGGRGIRICEFLNSSVENLISLIGVKPEQGNLSIDRVNNDGHYSCGSCRECLSNGWLFNIRWTTKKQQARNRRNSVFVTIGHETKTAAEWAYNVSIDPDVIYSRIKRGKTGMDLIAPTI